MHHHCVACSLVSAFDLDLRFSRRNNENPAASKMAGRLETYSKEEVRSIIRFLHSKGENPSEIHRQISEVYGEGCMCKAQVYNWVEKFKKGVASVHDADRPERGKTAVTPEKIEAVDNLIRQNRRFTIDEIASEVSISHGSVSTIIHEQLGYRKVYARWVPRGLTPEMKEARVEACQENLNRFEKEGQAFLDRIVTTDESWVHHFTPESKMASKEWRHSFSPPPRKFRAQPSAGKLMLTVFFDNKGAIVEHYMPRGTTVTSASYCDLLETNLKPAIRSMRRGLLSQGVLLLQDNARPHTAKNTKACLEKLKFEVLPHPPYSPDLAPCDFHLFGPLKTHLGGRRFKTDDDVKKAVHEWLRGQDKTFYSAGIQALPGRWRKCIEKGGDYIEK